MKNTLPDKKKRHAGMSEVWRDESYNYITSKWAQILLVSVVYLIQISSSVVVTSPQLLLRVTTTLEDTWAHNTPSKCGLSYSTSYGITVSLYKGSYLPI